MQVRIPPESLRLPPCLTGVRPSLQIWEGRFDSDRGLFGSVSKWLKDAGCKPVTPEVNIAGSTPARPILEPPPPFARGGGLWRVAWAPPVDAAH